MGKTSSHVIISNIEDTEDTEETYLKLKWREAHTNHHINDSKRNKRAYVTKKAFRIKQRIKTEWSRLLNYRIQNTKNKLTTLIIQITLKNG